MDMDFEVSEDSLDQTLLAISPTTNGQGGGNDSSSPEVISETVVGETSNAYEGNSGATTPSTPPNSDSDSDPTTATVQNGDLGGRNKLRKRMPTPLHPRLYPPPAGAMARNKLKKDMKIIRMLKMETEAKSNGYVMSDHPDGQSEEAHKPPPTTGPIATKAPLKQHSTDQEGIPAEIPDVTAKGITNLGTLGTSVTQTFEPSNTSVEEKEPEANTSDNLDNIAEAEATATAAKPKRTARKRKEVVVVAKRVVSRKRKVPVHPGVEADNINGAKTTKDIIPSTSSKSPELDSGVGNSASASPASLRENETPPDAVNNVNSLTVAIATNNHNQDEDAIMKVPAKKPRLARFGNPYSSPTDPSPPRMPRQSRLRSRTNAAKVVAAAEHSTETAPADIPASSEAASVNAPDPKTPGRRRRSSQRGAPKTIVTPKRTPPKRRRTPESFKPARLSRDIATLTSPLVPEHSVGESSVSLSRGSNSQAQPTFTNWASFLSAGCNFQFAPAVDYFKHAPMRDVWGQWGQITGSLFEVPNTYITNCMKPIYWLAHVVHFAGYKAFIQFESFGTEPEYVSCASYFSDLPKPLGYAVANGIVLFPPPEVIKVFPDYLEKARDVAKLTPTTIFPTHENAVKTILEKCQKYKLLQKVEVVDITMPERMTLATVVGLVGDRIHVKYDRDLTDDDPPTPRNYSSLLWFNVNSEQVHPLGWSRAIGAEFDGLAPTTSIPASVLPTAVPEVNIAKGQVLEVRHPFRLDTICAAVIHKVLKRGYFVVDIRTTSEEARTPTHFVFHVTSPYIFPCNSTQQNIIQRGTDNRKSSTTATVFAPPFGEPEDLFTWDSYISRLTLTPAPLHLLPKRADHRFEPGMKLETVLHSKPAVLTPATILNIVEHLLLIQYDDIDLERKLLWIDAESPDIYPIGYAELVGQAFEGRISAPALGVIVKDQKEKHWKAQVSNKNLTLRFTKY